MLGIGHHRGECWPCGEGYCKIVAAWEVLSPQALLAVVVPGLLSWGQPLSILLEIEGDRKLKPLVVDLVFRKGGVGGFGMCWCNFKLV